MTAFSHVPKCTRVYLEVLDFGTEVLDGCPRLAHWSICERL